MGQIPAGGGGRAADSLLARYWRSAGWLAGGLWVSLKEGDRDEHKQLKDEEEYRSKP